MLTPHPRAHIIRRDYQSCSLGTHQSSPRLHRLVLPSFSVGFSDKPTVPGVALLIRPFLFPFLPFAARLPPGLSGAFFGNSFFFLLFFFSLLSFPGFRFIVHLRHDFCHEGDEMEYDKANRSFSAKLPGSFFSSEWLWRR